MREILFRGKRLDNGEWVEGDLSYHVHDGEVYIFPKNGYDSPDCYEVDPKTVCQYTGLTDKNGKKIFDGYIISKRVNIYSLGGMKPTGERMLKGTVIWDESSTIYPGGWSINAKDEHGNDTVYAFDNGFEVIGNIFDNPELVT